MADKNKEELICEIVDQIYNTPGGEYLKIKVGILAGMAIGGLDPNRVTDKELINEMLNG